MGSPRGSPRSRATSGCVRIVPLIDFFVKGTSLPPFAARLVWCLNLIFLAVAALLVVVGVVLLRTDPSARHLDDGGKATTILVVAVCLLLYTGLNLLLRPWSGVNGRLWSSALLFSVMCLVCIGMTWQIVHLSHVPEEIVGRTVRSEREVAEFLHERQDMADAPYQVPTGVSVSTMEFVSSHNVRLTGFVWQRYAASIPEDVVRGVVLPEAAEPTPFAEAYRRVQADGTVLIGWAFNTVIRQEFAYRKYPLDRQNVWLRMWHSDFDRRVVLVPDFSSYPPWEDHLNLGLDDHFANVSFLPHYTAFSFALNEYQSSFGLGAYEARPAHPELYYNVGLGRRFRAPLGETLAPLALVALLVFAAIYITSVDHERRHKIGFSTLATLTLTMSAGFIVVTRHKSIIDATDVGGMIYLEIFPYLMYLMIGLAALNAVFYASTDVKWMGWRDNLLPALLFWPFVSGTLLAGTLAVLL